MAPARSWICSASHRRRCTRPDRGYVPGTTLRSRRRAAAMEIEHPARRAYEHQPGGGHPPPGHRGRSREPGEGGEHIVGRHQVRQPAHAHENVQRNAHQGLEDLRLAGGAPDRAFRGRARPALGERLARGVDEGAHPGGGVNVGHRDGGVAHAQGGDELRGGQGPAAVGEEVGIEAGHGAAQHGTPLLHNPGGVVGQVQRGRFGVGGSGPRQRPRQRVPVHLPAGLGGQGIDHGQQRNQRGRQALAEELPRGGQIDVRPPAGAR